MRNRNLAALASVLRSLVEDAFGEHTAKETLDDLRKDAQAGGTTLPKKVYDAVLSGSEADWAAALATHRAQSYPELRRWPKPFRDALARLDEIPYSSDAITHPEKDLIGSHLAVALGMGQEVTRAWRKFRKTVRDRGMYSLPTAFEDALVSVCSTIRTTLSRLPPEAEAWVRKNVVFAPEELRQYNPGTEEPIVAETLKAAFASARTRFGLRVRAPSGDKPSTGGFTWSAKSNVLWLRRDFTSKTLAGGIAFAAWSEVSQKGKAAALGDEIAELVTRSKDQAGFVDLMRKLVLGS